MGSKRVLSTVLRASRSGLSRPNILPAGGSVVNVGSASSGINQGLHHNDNLSHSRTFAESHRLPNFRQFSTVAETHSADSNLAPHDIIAMAAQSTEEMQSMRSSAPGIHHNGDMHNNSNTHINHDGNLYNDQDVNQDVMTARKERGARKRNDVRSLAKKMRDPERPTRPGSAFFIYLQDLRQQVAEAEASGSTMSDGSSVTDGATSSAEHPDSADGVGNPAPKGIAKMSKLVTDAGATWRAMSDEEKRPYVEKYNVIKEDYDQKMANYKESGKMTAWARDPEAPKRPLTAFFRFLRDYRAQDAELMAASGTNSADTDSNSLNTASEEPSPDSAKKSHRSSKMTEFTKRATEAYRELSEEQMQKYVEETNVAKLEYVKALEEYKNSGKEAEYKQRRGITELEEKVAMQKQREKDAHKSDKSREQEKIKRQKEKLLLKQKKEEALLKQKVQKQKAKEAARIVFEKLKPKLVEVRQVKVEADRMYREANTTERQLLQAMEKARKIL